MPSRKSKPVSIISCLAALMLLFVAAQQPGLKAAELPPPSIKIPPMVPEQSASTFIPSESAPGQGLAVNIIYPAKARYAGGAPVVVVVPGGTGADGLGFSMHAAQAGFVEVRFAFPGGGSPGFASGGSYDFRGPRCQKALRDILLFAMGRKADYQSRTMGDLLPVKVDTANAGMIGWSNGGNIALITLSRYANELSSLKWLAFFESPVGSLFMPPALGGVQDFILNKHYRQGSCATGNCLVDFRKLAYQADAQKSPGAHKRAGEPEVRGVVFFDENKNKIWDETSEFAFPYAAVPTVPKQIYPPAVTGALLRFKIFEKMVPVKKAPPPGEAEEGAEKRKEKEKKGDVQAEKEKEEAPRLELKVVWPEEIATLEESETFFAEEDGSLYLKDVCRKLPHLLVDVFGSRIDHLQAQPDHPHVAFLYNSFLANKIALVRLNPDPLYVSQLSGMSARNFVDNKPNASIDASTIEIFLEPEGFLPDYVFMSAAAAELADRQHTGKLEPNLQAPLVNYSNGAEPSPPARTPSR